MRRFSVGALPLSSHHQRASATKPIFGILLLDEPSRDHGRANTQCQPRGDVIEMSRDATGSASAPGSVVNHATREQPALNISINSPFRTSASEA